MNGGRLDTHSRVLVPNRTKSLLAAGLDATSLTSQQLGIFDGDTGLSIAASGKKCSSIYLGLGVTDDVIVTGLVDTASISSITDCFKPAVPNLFVLKDINTKCETTYSIKLAVHTNMSKIMQGYLPIYKTFPIVTPCCDDPCDCGSGNSCTDAAIQFARGIASDPDQLAKAYLIDNAASDFTNASAYIDPLDVAAVDAAILAGGANFCFAVVVEPNIEKVYKFCQIPYKSGHSFVNAGQDHYRVQLLASEGFDCMGNIIEVRASQFSGMTEADLNLQDYMQQPYIGSGEPGVNRVLKDGVPIGSSVPQDRFTGKYSVIALHGLHSVTVGANQRGRAISFQIAIPCDTTASSIATQIYNVLNYHGVFNLDATGFSALDSCACS